MVRRRSGGWILAAAGAALVLLVAAAILKITFEDLPASASPEAIEGRFESQIRFLRDLAATYPARECESVPPIHRDPGEMARFVEQLGDRGEWEKHVEESADLFSDPVILGASIVCYQSDRTITLDLKRFDEPANAVSRAMVLPRKLQPKVSLWYAGEERFIKYEDKVGDSSGKTRGFELFLDVDQLEAPAGGATP